MARSSAPYLRRSWLLHAILVLTVDFSFAFHSSPLPLLHRDLRISTRSEVPPSGSWRTASHHKMEKNCGISDSATLRCSANRLFKRLFSGSVSGSGDSSQRLILASSSIGLATNFGLLMASVALVQMVGAIFKSSKISKEKEPVGAGNSSDLDPYPPEEQQIHAGIMNRCPWPFIFFHDPVQGMKDSPTWIVVAWFVLRRLVKLRKAALVA